MQQPMVDVQPHGNVILPCENSTQAKKQKYQKAFYGFGITELTLGIISILITIITYTLRYRYTYYRNFTNISSGIWCSIFLIPTGILGISARSNPSQCLIIANMILSIISAVFMVVQLSMGIIGSIVYAHETPAASGLHALLAIIGFAALVLLIIHSAYTCSATCCIYNNNGSYGYAASTQQVVQLPNGARLIVLQGAGQTVIPGSTDMYPPGQYPTQMANPAIPAYTALPAYQQPQYQPVPSGNYPHQASMSSAPQAYTGQPLPPPATTVDMGFSTVKTPLEQEEGQTSTNLPTAPPDYDAHFSENLLA